MDRMHQLRDPLEYTHPTPTPFNSVQKPQLGAIRLQNGLAGFTELSASTVIPVENLQLGAPAN